jgi:hypothetical protein
MEMNEDFEKIKKILKGHSFSDSYVDILLSHINNELEKLNRTQITPNFLYSTLSYQVGKNTAKGIAEDFEDYKKTGVYKSKIQRFLDRSPWMK